MKLRLVTAAALTGALFLSMAGAEAGPPVLDGKKVELLTISGTGGLQTNDKDIAGSTTEERLACSPPRCARLPFVYKPAKGVKGGLLLTVAWSKPVSDFDLYLAVLDKRGNATAVGNCGGSASTSEKVYAAPADLKSGKSYVMVIDYYRSVNETMTAKVEINVPNTIKTTVPSAADSKAFLNCST